MVRTCSAGTPFTATMRARKDGTRAISPTPGMAPATASNRPTWSFWMSMKKNAGARSGIRSTTWRWRLPWIIATEARVERPRPSETSISALAEPGRCRLAKPSLSAGGRCRGAAAAARCTAQPPSRNSPSVTAAAAQNQAAKTRSCATATVSPTSAMASAALAATRERRGGVRRSPRPSRNSAIAGTARARASGQSAKVAAVSSPKAAASASGSG